MDEIKSKAILLFDGDCLVCNATVAFLLRHDRRGRLYFAPYRSETGRALSVTHDIDADEAKSVALIDNGKCYLRAAAVARVLMLLGSVWVVPGCLVRLVPAVISNAVYDWVAARRYRLFGKSDRCHIPTQEQQQRFL